MAKPGAKRINLALQGGGAHGAITWGVVDRLLEDERIEIEGISGASAGAVNAAALAYGIHLDGCEGGRRQLDLLWRTISRKGSVFSPAQRSPFDVALGAFGIESSTNFMAFDAFTRMFSPYQFNPLNINPLKEILEECVDFEKLRCCQSIKLFLSATNVRTGKVHIFDAKQATVEAVLASTCLPFLFQAVEINGEHYWDGGYMGNPVLFPFFYESEFADILVVHVNPIEREALPVTAPTILNRINEISFNASLLREFRAINFVQRMLEEGWLKDEYRDRLRNIHIHSVRSDVATQDLPIASKFNVDWGFLTNLKERGRDLADAWLQENFEHIGYRSSVDLRAMFDGVEGAHAFR